MTRCGDVMTREMASCEPADSIVKVAQLMKTKNVGAVPVVDSASSRKVVGIVTDRDVVMKLVAGGRAVDTATIRDVMTADVVTCQEDDDIGTAVSRMAERQVRRIPVVDGSGALRGIIAQADIATRVQHDKTTGELVEAISEPAAARQ